MKEEKQEQKEERVKTPEEIETERIQSKKKEQALTIAKRFPESLHAYPRGTFENQLADFIIKEGFIK